MNGDHIDQRIVDTYVVQAIKWIGTLAAIGVVILALRGC